METVFLSKEDIKVYLRITISLLLLSVLILGVIGGTWVGIDTFKNYKYCEQMKAFNINYNFEWGFFTGCLINVDNTWVDANNFLQLENYLIQLKESK